MKKLLLLVVLVGCEIPTYNSIYERERPPVEDDGNRDWECRDCEAPWIPLR